MNSESVNNSSRGIMHFIGVNTAGSSALKLFPRWAEALGITGAKIIGVDIDLDADPAIYRRELAKIKSDPSVRGALVTSHKLNLLSSSVDLFDRLSEDSKTCSEVSCIYKRNDKLFAHAPDAACANRVMRRMIGESYWEDHSQAELILLGCGGASVALLLSQYISGRRTPAKIEVIDKNQSRLDHLSKVASSIGLSSKVHCSQTEKAEDNDIIVQQASPFSMIVNATGMGKDIPGSPLTNKVRFPSDSIAWELNYRGPRLFMKQAENAGAKIFDGWDLFVMNWYFVISTIWDLEMNDEKFESFKRASDLA